MIHLLIILHEDRVANINIDVRPNTKREKITILERKINVAMSNEENSTLFNTFQISPNMDNSRFVPYNPLLWRKKIVINPQKKKTRE